MSWTSPECPYGVINRYIVYYRKSDTIQTGVITNTGYTTKTVDFPPPMQISDLDYALEITDLLAYTNYTVHVQAIIRGNTPQRSGRVELELLNRTRSSVDDPPLVGSGPTQSPTSSNIVIRIGDPSQIDTGKVV